MDSQPDDLETEGTEMEKGTDGKMSSPYLGRGVHRDQNSEPDTKIERVNDPELNVKMSKEFEI